ncbi:nicotinamide N-methyltransferase [Coccidioides immitis RS]|uniref:Nicotinamide N-methyltransferase n=1 Tax=Coccidioides immitis (strain RS) TaxID=246410 RepID=A0A0D8JUX3_COCIM|nr:nicotinamide N-methyltransferase [Coccidioides immitis RS]KJF60088.1 nicotinamide N-methyltransferase [Coccidioides immitis RS]
MLPSRIQPLRRPSTPPPPPTLTPTSSSPPQPTIDTNATDPNDAEDLLSSFLPHLYPDEAPSCLGNPGQTLLYTSPLFGGVRVVVPDYGCKIAEEEEEEEKEETEDQKGTTAREREGEEEDAGVEAGRRLFAHYLWGGALVVAERIEEAERLRRVGGGRTREEENELVRRWGVRGQKVLEVGAGTALPSLIAALAGAETVCITDHPSSAALAGAVQSGIAHNIPERTIRERISVHPHEWGVFFENQSSGRENPAEDGDENVIRFAADNKGAFTRIICADCLWMRDQHENLVRSLLWFLKAPAKTEQGSTAGPVEDRGEEAGVAWVVAGFHTGREIVALFFETAVSMGLVVEEIYERDVNATSEMGEVTREWRPVREGEGPENRARWCVVALLRKKN